MTTRNGPIPGEGDSAEDPRECADAFAGLTPIDVIDGELVPRARTRRG